ncbi:MAG: biotin/lipoyl-binding protein [Acidimicrobiales bacterium]|nr:biotin/lipoyl-binding protein [Acidimicrobiales bacterium]
MTADAEQAADAEPTPARGRTPLYRSRALERSGRVEPIDGLLRVTAPHEWVILAAVAAALFAAAVWAAVATVERGVTVPCTAAQPGESHLVTAPAAGIVADVLVSRGDRVEAGQLLARVSNPERATPVAQAQARLAAREAAGADLRDAAAARVELAELERLRLSGIEVRSPAGGVVATVAALSGARVEPGGAVVSLRSGAGHRLAAVAALDAAAAGEVRPGMTARVSWHQATADPPLVVAAEVVAVAASAAAESAGGEPGGSEWVHAAPLPGAPAAGHRAVLAFDEALPPSINHGAPCTARITISSGSPLRFLRLSGRPAAAEPAVRP